MVIGLTGGIGSGKSTVARLFEVLGYPVFNSDEAAKRTYFYPDVKAAVIALLGPEAYHSANTLNKTYIASRIFSDTRLLTQLNAIVHPQVKADFLQFVALQGKRWVVKETALLFEARLQNEVDKILVVNAPDAIRINRVVQRDGLTQEEVLKKMQSQLPQADKIAQAHFVIHNNEQESLIEQVLAIHAQLMQHTT